MSSADGIDLYRDALSWSPFPVSTTPGQQVARSPASTKQPEASRSPLARPGVLTSSTAIIAAADPLAELGRLIHARPGLSRALARRSLAEDFTRHHLPTIEKAAPLLSGARTAMDAR